MEQAKSSANLTCEHNLVTFQSKDELKGSSNHRFIGYISTLSGWDLFIDRASADYEVIKMKDCVIVQELNQ